MAYCAATKQVLCHADSALCASGPTGWSLSQPHWSRLFPSSEAPGTSYTWSSGGQALEQARPDWRLESAVAASHPSPCFPRTCPGTRAARDAPPRAARSGSLVRRTGAPPSCPTALFPGGAHGRGHVATASRDWGG